MEESCAKFIAFLRSLYLIHQNHHWISKGDAFYADHLLFERIYKSAAENADLAAEKFIGLFGQKTLDISNQPKFISEFLSKYSNTTDIIEQSLQAEKDFIEFAQKLYDEFKKSNHMTLGLDDMIMSISSDRETAVYLLQRTLTSQENKKGMKMSKLIDLAKKFQVKLAQVNPAAPVAGTATPATAENKNLEDVAMQIKQELAATLGLNVQSDDVKFTKLRFVDDGGKKSIEWAMAISPNAAKQFQSAVDNVKQHNVGFSVPRFITQSFMKKLPGFPVLPAQPIMIG